MIAWSGHRAFQETLTRLGIGWVKELMRTLNSCNTTTKSVSIGVGLENIWRKPLLRHLENWEAGTLIRND
jgi:phosphoglycerate-specific signal transduction histidine kinase